MTMFGVIICFTLLFNRYQIISKKGHIERLRCNSQVSISSLSFQHSEPENYDVTMVLQTSTNRLFCLKYLLQRWKGQLSITIYLNQQQNENELGNYTIIQNNRIHYLVYQANSSIYPINHLRNMAIKNVKTTHLFVCDMDYWPSSNLYDSFMNLPNHFLSDDWLAIIVPGFEYKHSISHCKDYQSCIESYANTVPKTKKELKECLDKKMCQIVREEFQGHKYVYDNWINEPESKTLVMIQSFKNKIQEPYFIIPKNEHLPLFSELFYNYGKDKIQWVENVRYVGYKFGMFVQSYCIDIPHPISKYKSDWLTIKQRTGKKLFADVYEEFVKNLHQKQPDRSIVYIEES